MPPPLGMPPAVGPSPQAMPADDGDAQARALAEQISATGSTGLLRTSVAGSGETGSFRVAFLTDFFNSTGFLCNATTPCDAAATEDETGRFGALFAVNATPWRFLEGYAGVHASSNGVGLGAADVSYVAIDATFGVKVFTPTKIKDVVSLGGELRVLVQSGAGDVKTGDRGVGAEFGLLSSFDFRKMSKKVPMRLHLNGFYHLDNSADQLVDLEVSRAAADPQAAGTLTRIPVSRSERFVVGANRVDAMNVRVGLDMPFATIQPYLEYSLDVPLNRQGYTCETQTIAQGDVCLALQDLDDPFSGDAGYAMVPSRLSIGARATPFDGRLKGLSAHLAFDIGLSGTSTFIEEVAPEAPWTMYLGLGYVFDGDSSATAPPAAAPPPAPAAAAQHYVRGVVNIQGTVSPVAGAIIGVQGQAVPPVATGA
ncbi:MAG: hypothetical protein VB934_07540, partial [Polyangiaceae bacterium]